MLKKTITYTDYDGNERKEDFYFNLSQAELVEMAYSTNGGFDKMLERIVQERDNTKIVAIIKEMILKAYGQKSLDGKHFVKSKELSDEFSQTEAFSELFLELLSNANEALAFVKGIVPAKIASELEKQDLTVLEGSTTPSLN